MATHSSSLSLRSSRALPSPWRGFAWALRGAPQDVAARALVGALQHGKPLRQWMALVHDLRHRGLVDDERREYLRALRPVVHGGTDIPSRIAQLIAHTDWLEQGFQSRAFEQLMHGQPVVVADMQPPRGYDQMRLQLQRAVRHSPEGELLLTLTLRRSAKVQVGAQPVEIAALAFTRIRLEGLPCLAIGGVRGQREVNGRVSTTEVVHALQGWRAPVFLVRVAQELARYWGLHLVGLDPVAHRLQGWPWRWSRSHREASGRIFASYEALWAHFGAKKGPPGWVVLPLNSDEKLEATALSPERRLRQVRRADFWIRTRNLLRDGFKAQLVRQAPESRAGGVTQNLGPRTIAQEPSQWEDPDFQNSEEMVPSLSLDSGPGALD